VHGASRRYFIKNPKFKVRSVLSKMSLTDALPAPGWFQSPFHIKSSPLVRIRLHRFFARRAQSEKLSNVALPEPLGPTTAVIDRAKFQFGLFGND